MSHGAWILAGVSRCLRAACLWEGIQGRHVPFFLPPQLGWSGSHLLALREAQPLRCCDIKVKKSKKVKKASSPAAAERAAERAPNIATNEAAAQLAARAAAERERVPFVLNGSRKSEKLLPAGFEPATFWFFRRGSLGHSH